MNKLNQFFRWIYIAIFCHFLWLLGFFIGLGFLSFLPTTVATFAMLKEWKHAIVPMRVKLFKHWWLYFQQALKKHVWINLIYIIFIFIFVTNFLFLKTRSSFLTEILFYITFLLILFFLMSGLFYAYLAAQNLTTKIKELVNNAFAYTIVRLKEILFVSILFIGLLMFFSTFFPGMLIFIGIGFLLVGYDWLFTQLVTGKSFDDLSHYWRRED